MTELCDERFVQNYGEHVAEQLQREGRWAGEAALKACDGNALPVWGTIRKVSNPDDAARYVVSASDLASAPHDHDNLAVMAMIDPLTGLRNRRALLEHLRFALLRGQRHGTRVGLLYLDLDGFKAINDTHGHEAGDEVLRQVGSRLLAAVRATDVCARIGGDEFTVVAEDVRGTAAMALVGGKVQHALAAPVVVRGRPLRVGASLGSALSRKSNTTAEGLLDAADKAMYLAKRRRKAARRRQATRQ